MVDDPLTEIPQRYSGQEPPCLRFGERVEEQRLSDRCSHSDLAGRWGKSGYHNNSARVAKHRQAFILRRIQPLALSSLKRDVQPERFRFGHDKHGLADCRSFVDRRRADGRSTSGTRLRMGYFRLLAYGAKSIDFASSHYRDSSQGKSVAKPWRFFL